MHADDSDLPVLPGRLRRLAEELADEGVPALAGAPDDVSALVELAYALRPHVHEGRVPSYGALLPPAGFPFDAATDELGASLIPLGDLDAQFARRFADGVTTFSVRTPEGIGHLACFSANMADEYDLVGLQLRLGGLVVQRHPAGEVRVFGPAGVIRWDGARWRHDAPVAAWISRLQRVSPGTDLEDVRPILRFAIHELGGRHIGATLIWRPTLDGLPSQHLEPLVHHVPRLRLVDAGEEAAIAHALSQTDGAAIFDAGSTLVAMGIRLVPSAAAERSVDALLGMRHTSALRYSHDDPEAVVIVVSEAGPVTLMHRGEAITTAHPGDEQIG